MATLNRTRVGLWAAGLCALSMSYCSKSSPAAGGTGGSTSGGTGGSTSGAGTSGGNSGSTSVNDMTCVNQDMDNPDCMAGLSSDPQTGSPCDPKGTCCHRASNIAKEAALGPDDSMVLEYRLNYNQTTNHPKTIGSPLPVATGLATYTKEAQNVLWRLTVPRKGGMEVSGMGSATFGYGRYNCDGTYSFYSSTAAPMGALSNDPARWAAKTVPMMVDVTKTSADRFHFAFADQVSRRQFINLPYVATAKADYPLDWELSFMGFNLFEMKTEDAGHDCVGGGKVGGGANGWTPGGTYEVYTPVFGNNKSIITDLSVTYCTLVSFGISAGKGLNCETEARCMPGTLKDGSGASCKPDAMKYPTASDDPCCQWLKLPDGLCPATADDQKVYNCHLGAKGNPNMETGYPSDTDLKCTATAPTSALDPDMGATSNGQCCDPMGKDTTIPVCNSFRLIQEYVAAAAHITKVDSDKLQGNCAVKQ